MFIVIELRVELLMTDVLMSVNVTFRIPLTFRFPLILTSEHTFMVELLITDIFAKSLWSVLLFITMELRVELFIRNTFARVHTFMMELFMVEIIAVSLSMVELLICFELRVELLMTDELMSPSVPVIVPHTFRLPRILAVPLVDRLPLMNTSFWNISIISFPPKLIFISSVSPSPLMEHVSPLLLMTKLLPIKSEYKTICPFTFPASPTNN